MFQPQHQHAYQPTNFMAQPAMPQMNFVPQPPMQRMNFMPQPQCNIRINTDTIWINKLYHYKGRCWAQCKYEKAGNKLLCIKNSFRIDRIMFLFCMIKHQDVCMSWDNIKILHNKKVVRRSKQCQCSAVGRSTCSTGRSWQCPSCGCAHHTTECVSSSSGVMWNCVQSTFCPGTSSATIAIDSFYLPCNCTKSDSNVKIIKQFHTSNQFVIKTTRYNIKHRLL